MTHDEVLEKCDKHREIHEGVGLSDELVRIVTFAYEQGFCRALAQSLAEKKAINDCEDES